MILNCKVIQVLTGLVQLMVVWVYQHHSWGCKNFPDTWCVGKKKKNTQVFIMLIRMPTISLAKNYNYMLNKNEYSHIRWLVFIIPEMQAVIIIRLTLIVPLIMQTAKYDTMKTVYTYMMVSAQWECDQRGAGLDRLTSIVFITAHIIIVTTLMAGNAGTWEKIYSLL